MSNEIKVPGKSVSKKSGEFTLQMLDQVDAMLAYWDKDLVCRIANNAYLDWFGRTKEEMIDRMRIDELLGPLLYKKNLPHIKAALLGNKQLFEREIPIPGGDVARDSLASYTPDIVNGEVLGFFVHVADVTYLKNLEKEIAIVKRDSLRKIIENEEQEKRYLVDILRESINQQLAGCKMAIEREQKKGIHIDLYDDIGLRMTGIIKEINLLCQDLVPTEIEMIGLVETLGLHIKNLSRQQDKKIHFVSGANGIEEIRLADKYSVFRIIQNLLKIFVAFDAVTNLEVSLIFNEPQVTIRLRTDAKISLDKRLKEYHSVVCRVEYYSGKIRELLSDEESILETEFLLTG
jgi:hypothetical protein